MNLDNRTDRFDCGAVPDSHESRWQQAGHPLVVAATGDGRVDKPAQRNKIVEVELPNDPPDHDPATMDRGNWPCPFQQSRTASAEDDSHGRKPPRLGFGGTLTGYRPVAGIDYEPGDFPSDELPPEK